MKGQISASLAEAAESGQKTYERVFDSIKRYIVDNNLKPGDKLPREVDLCKELCVSRNTIREALKSLQKLGIIDAKQKEGMIIREFNYDPIIENLEYSLMMSNQKLIDLINLRITLELAYIEEAIARSTFAQILRMRAIVEDMERKTAQGRSLLEDDMAFHMEMYSQVDNELFQNLNQLFWKLLIKIQNQRQDVDFDPKPRDTVSIHQGILNYFSLGECQNCAKALREHYFVRDRLLSLMLDGPAPRA